MTPGVRGFIFGIAVYWAVQHFTGFGKTGRK